MPLTPCPAPGVAAGVAGVTPLPACCKALPPCNGPFTNPDLPFACCDCPSFSDDGGVRWPAPPGKDSEVGAVKSRACCAVDGWVMYAASMLTVRLRSGSFCPEYARDDWQSGVVGQRWPCVRVCNRDARVADADRCVQDR